MLTWDQTGTYEVSELQGSEEDDGNEDWMTMLLQTKAFHKIPPANIQAIFMRMQQINYKRWRCHSQARCRGRLLSTC